MLACQRISRPELGLVIALTVMAGHPSANEGVEPVEQSALGDVDLTVCRTIEGIGKGQGVEVRDGFVYLYGDADTGVIRQYRLVNRPKPDLQYTGLEIRLTRKGKDLISHPTGLTFHPKYGTFLGDSVKNEGTIYHVDWKRMLAERTLDNAVLNVTSDDLAISGTRPEFVRRRDRWYVATADYRDWGNFVRLYDPVKLTRAAKTSQPGVLVAKYPCDAYVQNLHWIDERELLVLVQNQTGGDDWRLTFVTRPWDRTDYRALKTFDRFKPKDELEGFHVLGAGRCIMISSSLVRNVWIGRAHLP